MASTMEIKNNNSEKEIKGKCGSRKGVYSLEVCTRRKEKL